MATLIQEAPIEAHGLPAPAERRPWVCPEVSEVNDWLVEQGLRQTAMTDVVQGFCERLVALGLPLWRNRLAVRRNFLPMMAALLAGSLTAIGSAVAIAWAFGAPREIPPRSQSFPPRRWCDVWAGPGRT